METPVLNSSRQQFVTVMEELAAAISVGDARRGADCYTSNVVFYEPSTKFLLRSREEIYQLFGGEKPHKGSLRWHHLGFNSATQIGFAEFTLNYGSPVHGIVIVQISEGKIAIWREYYFDSTLAWNKFILDSALPADCWQKTDQLDSPSAASTTENDFQHLLQAIADWWGKSDTEKVTDNFTDDAIFIELPKREQHTGREDIQAYFKEKATVAPVQLTWHQSLLNEAKQIGIGEYTLKWDQNQLHGIMIAKICSGRISHWREYQFTSDGDWQEFMGESIVLNPR